MSNMIECPKCHNLYRYEVFHSLHNLCPSCENRFTEVLNSDARITELNEELARVDDKLTERTDELLDRFLEGC
jgi:transcription initiation factor IIE alpha subunit